eukprot:gene5230-biopygen2361
MFLHCPPRLSIAVRLDNRSPRPSRGGSYGHGSELGRSGVCEVRYRPALPRLQTPAAAPGCSQLVAWLRTPSKQHGWTEPGRGSNSVHTCHASGGVVLTQYITGCADLPSADCKASCAANRVEELLDRGGLLGDPGAGNLESLEPKKRLEPEPEEGHLGARGGGEGEEHEPAVHRGRVSSGC